MKGNPLLPGQCADFRYGLYRPYLIAGVADGDEDGLRCYPGCKFLHIDLPVLIDRQPGNLEALFLQILGDVVYGDMLNLGDDDVITLVSIARCITDKSYGIRFCRAGGEYNLIRLRIDKAG